MVRKDYSNKRSYKNLSKNLNFGTSLAFQLKGVDMSKNIKYLEIKKQFDDMIYEIVKTSTFNYSDEINKLVRQISPQIEKINNLLEEKK